MHGFLDVSTNNQHGTGKGGRYNDTAFPPFVWKSKMAETSPWNSEGPLG